MLWFNSVTWVSRGCHIMLVSIFLAQTSYLFHIHSHNILRLFRVSSYYSEVLVWGSLPTVSFRTYARLARGGYLLRCCRGSRCTGSLQPGSCRHLSDHICLSWRHADINPITLKHGEYKLEEDQPLSEFKHAGNKILPAQVAFLWSFLGAFFWAPILEVFSWILSILLYFSIHLSYFNFC